MEPKFTKGKWTMNVTDKFVNNKGLAITSRIRNKNVLIAEVSHDLTDKNIKEYEANAELIVHAPQMFEMLTKLQTRLETLINATPSGKFRNQLTAENIEAKTLLNECVGIYMSKGTSIFKENEFIDSDTDSSPYQR